ncbi:hypothetical protein K503DRAFT_789797 [Rhizopogon vinicolor AM-OR11-026]|uniref:Conserved oligomeric Golgi complex subunit 1 n=1 Tax=Rhizopogon vinicolor AM-OR11-026 TaxID=1314800 RepID=A0A1B7NDS6_9AGAM|nr:hypothetical protein K503DRAFT_789797 [Rhizopogon vinicolor AM-OR11-026]
MARRSSTVSVVSLGSIKGLADVSHSASALTFAPSPSALKSTRSVPLIHPSNAQSVRTQNETAGIDPDELFTKCTIAEVKAKQVQLRSDAEAKQEELRVMVGERYRDLLQASTSIISMSKSAKRVQEAFEETKDAIVSQQQPSRENRTSNVGKGDSHLQTLQVLSAHIKLLLDAPEHLWRLIEQEKYFHATWLFILARVVHRALSRDDDQDEASWLNKGINVMEQFPLIQRQWETIYHFQTQIIHRATLSLRAYEKSSEDTCGTIMTLHILESRPLADTLTTYLSQRTRTMHTLVSKRPSIAAVATPNGNPPTQTNGHLPGTSKPAQSTAMSPKDRLREVKSSLLIVVEVISKTVNSARDVFQSQKSAQPALAVRVLEQMHAESPAVSEPVPPELALNAQTILSGLPSSSYFALLPTSIRSYKPYVELSSASSSVPGNFLEDKLRTWFDQSCSTLRDALDRWLLELDSVKSVWTVRSSLRKWLLDSGLVKAERITLHNLLEEAVRNRITTIWTNTIYHAKELFLKALTSLTPDSEVGAEEFSPLKSIYVSPSVPAPPLSGSGPSAYELPYQKYRTALQLQLRGRTPRLQAFLSILEESAASLQKDYTHIGSEESSRELVHNLVEAYLPEAKTFCSTIADALTSTADKLMIELDTARAMKSIIFLSRVAIEISLASPFLDNIGCDEGVALGFRDKTGLLFDRIINWWKEHTISSIISRYDVNFLHLPLSTSPVTGPSPALMASLHTLSTSLHSLGLTHHPSQLISIAPSLLGLFIDAFTRAVPNGDTDQSLQTLNDATFLRCLVSTWPPEAFLTSSLDDLILALQSEVQSSRDPLVSGLGQAAAKQYLMGTQMLLSALVSPFGSIEPTKEGADKMSTLLTYGVPVSDTTFSPAVELAKVSTRFPLLLVETR